MSNDYNGRYLTPSDGWPVGPAVEPPAPIPARPYEDEPGPLDFVRLGKQLDDADFTAAHDSVRPELVDAIRAAEVCVRHLASYGGLPVLSTRCVLEPGDLEKLQAGGSVWVHFYGGQLLPFDVNVLSPGAPELATD